MAVSTEVKNAIVNEMADELKEREYYYQKSSLNQIVTECFNQKKDLIELLSKHPNWNPAKFMIQFDTDMEREINADGVIDFADWLIRKLNIRYDYRAVRQSREYNICYFIKTIRTQFFNEYENAKEDLDRINALNENFKLRTNMKCSKAVGKICREEGWDKLEGFNQKYASFCDCLNPLKITRHTVISLNPLDYLLMSNGNSWNSCHDIGDADSAGCYSSGTISYMLDKHSFIFYTVDGSYNGDKIELEPKIQRQVFGYNDEVLVQLRLYPQSNDSGAKAVYDNIRAIVQKVVADCLGKPNMWIKTTSDVEDVVESGRGATCYPDWEDGNPGSTHCSVSTLKDRGERSRTIVFGAEPICINCGYRHGVEEYISCCDSDDYEICECCGDRIDSDDVYWCGDDPYCSNCVSYCEDCCEYYPNDDVEEIDGRYVCKWCREDGDYYHCEECGELHHVDDMAVTADGHKYCDDCADDLVYECEECGDDYLKENLQYDEETDCLYCDKCYEKLLEEREKESA